MIHLEFSAEDLETLRHERLYHPHPRVRQRLEAVYLKSRNVPHQDICASVQITKPTGVEVPAPVSARGTGGAQGGAFSTPRQCARSL